jgi:hypothetical protein
VQLVRGLDDAAFLHDGLEHLQVGEVHRQFSERGPTLLRNREQLILHYSVFEKLNPAYTSWLDRASLRGNRLKFKRSISCGPTAGLSTCSKLNFPSCRRRWPV